MLRISDYRIHIFCIPIMCGISFGLECYINTEVDDSGPVVMANIGTVVGKYVSVMDNKIAAFLGIPFAKPPVGEMRFKIPEPFEPTSNILFAKEKSPACMQYSSREVGWIPPPTFKFSEDCLYLNVWLPPNCCCNRLDKLPVMAFIYGGGYYSGSAMMDVYDGGVLATYGEVIVVTVNYRLGIFGFLNIDTMEAPGNMGLYDQLLGLQWIRENILHFGGDPNRVTLFGESAGSFAVSLQLVSPLSQNLFHKAILESGTAAQPLTVDNVDASLTKAVQFSNLIGCQIDRSNSKNLSREILNCLKTKSGEDLAFTENYYTSQFPAYFVPSFGNKCEQCSKYFLKNPKKALRSGEFTQKPILIGNNKNEGTLFMIYTIPRQFMFDQKPLINIPIAKQALRDFFMIVQETTLPSDKVFDYYVENITCNTTDVPLHTVSRIIGDFLINCANMIFADNVKDAYYYLYTHRSVKNTDDKWVGVPHFSEIAYVFGDPIRDIQNYTSEDRKVSEDILQKWSSFAHHGYPLTKDSEPQWPKYSSSDRKVYGLNARRGKILQFPYQKACEEIWKPFFEQ